MHPDSNHEIEELAAGEDASLHHHHQQVDDEPGCPVHRDEERKEDAPSPGCEL